MTANGPLDVDLNLKIKEEKEDVNEDDDEDDDDDDDDGKENVSYLLEPSILDNTDILASSDDPKDEFLHLTSLVRRVYFSYLHKSVINNYNICCKSDLNLSRRELKKFASYLELQAVKACLEASLYRQIMLKIISDIKSNTNQGKIHKKLAFFLELGPTKKDANIQTSEPINNVNNLLSTEMSFHDKLPVKKKEKDPIANDLNLILGDIDNVYENTVGNCINNEINLNQLFDEPGKDGTIVEEESRDSLIQHLEDMFCESDDSSDLMNLIEKHSGVKKSSIDSEISKMCVGMTETPAKHNEINQSKENCHIPFENLSNRGDKRKLTFDNYKKLKKRNQQDFNAKQELSDDKQLQKLKKKGVWFIERVHQVTKLRNLVIELSTRNYRKYGRIRAKFIELFGESDDEEMMPESPIPIEEHLNSCKDRIVPWVVKHLMPYYNKKIIRERLLFKAVAKHVVDMLIIENTFPEEDCVIKFIKNYFRNKPSINTQADIY